MITNEAHISTAFDKDLRQIEELVVAMGGLVEKQIEDAATLMQTRDLELADQLRADDKQVDRMEQEIDHLCVRIIALRQPAATDLRSVLAAQKVAADLERIGDYAKNIAKRTHVLAQSDPIGSSAKTIARMCMLVREMVRDVLNAYLARDDQAALAVRDRDEDVDQMNNQLFRALLTYMMEDASRITPCMHLLFISKNVERMGDHATSIAEQIVFRVTGEMPDEDRPKSDVTSMTSVDPQ